MSIINRVFESLEPFMLSACTTVSKFARNRRTFYIDTSPYLTRFYLTKHARDEGEIDPKKRLGIYLHYFHCGDVDDALHNHPWFWSFSIILTNGYLEQRWDPRTRSIQTHKLRPGSINVIRANDFHRVDLIDPSRGAWTLFVSGRRVKEEWGFWLPGVHKFFPHHTFRRSGPRNVRFS